LAYRAGGTGAKLHDMSSRTTHEHRVSAHPDAAHPLEERRRGPRVPSFARALWRITSADVSPGNSVELYADGNETFDAMIALIDGAQKTVDMESYIFRGDGVGQRFAESLSAAAERGVRVRVLADWIGMRGTKRAFFDAMRKRGVDVRVFNRLGFGRWFGLIPRDHRKLLVADGLAGITGGIGIGDEWHRNMLMGRKRLPWRDRCVRIEGLAGLDMERAFDNMWRRAAGERPTRAERRLRRAPRNSTLEPETADPALVAVVEGEPGRFRVGRAMHLGAAAAERSIWLASAYFIPSFAEVDSLTGAARDGVDVRLLLPSNNDHPWVHKFTRRFYRTLLANGVRIWEWRGDMMHAKTSVMDSRWTRVGSTDFNPLGVAINYELDVFIEDAAVGKEAEDLFLADLDLSREIKSAPRA
jgi:cardiolipin synthase